MITTPLHVFDISNPSDPLTMLAPSLAIAGFAICIISPSLGVSNEALGDSPVMFGWKEWLDSHCGQDHTAYLDANHVAIVAALRSVCLGKAADRADFDSAVRAIDDPAKLATFIAERNDRRRSSLNDIETACHRMATLIEDRIKARDAGAAAVQP